MEGVEKYLKLQMVLKVWTLLSTDKLSLSSSSAFPPPNTIQPRPRFKYRVQGSIEEYPKITILQLYFRFKGLKKESTGS